MVTREDSVTCSNCAAAEARAVQAEMAEPEPCEICQWPRPVGAKSNYLICPCCGFEPGYDDKMAAPYKWNGEWWDKEEPMPTILSNALACVAGLEVAASGSQDKSVTPKGALKVLPDAAPHMDAVKYAREQIVPLYRLDEEGTPYERGQVRQIAAHWLAGYFAARPPSEAVSAEDFAEIPIVEEGKATSSATESLSSSTVVPLPDAATPAPRWEAIEALIQRWRDEVKAVGDFMEAHEETLRDCADELSALLHAPPVGDALTDVPAGQATTETP